MFDSIGHWDFFLPASAAAVTAGAIWIAARHLTRALSVEARDARRIRDRLAGLAASSGLRVAESLDRLEGRTGGWPVEVRRAWLPVQPGGVPAEHWSIRLHADAPPMPGAHAVPAPPAGLFPARRDQADLVADVPVGDDARLSEQLAWMAATAAHLHTPRLHGPDGTDPLDTACRGLQLKPDATLPRWTGTWRGRSVLVERLAERPIVLVHLALQVVLPPGLWVGSRDHLDASGDPVPLPLRPAASALAASAASEGVDAARELLQDADLIGALAPHLSDGRGSRVHGGVVTLARPTVVFTVSPRQVLVAAEGVAHALEAAIERPWRALAEAHGLSVQSTRHGGLPILTGRRAGFALTVQRAGPDHTVVVRAEPEGVRLLPGLQIHQGAGRGVPTGNPIFDQHLSVTARAPMRAETLQQLPLEAILPLFLGPCDTAVTDAGVTVLVPPPATMEELRLVLGDLDQLLPRLPLAEGPPPT